MKRIVLLVVIAGAWGVGAQRPAPPARMTLSVGGPAGAAAIGDFNRDGRNDIAATAGNAVFVFLGDGRGGFERSARSPFGAGENPSDLVVADFNRDGHLDAAVANHETDYLSVLNGDGNGALADPSHVPVPSRPHPHGIAAGDFNADGHLDVAVESWEEDTVLVVTWERTWNVCGRTSASRRRLVSGVTIVATWRNAARPRRCPRTARRRR